MNPLRIREELSTVCPILEILIVNGDAQFVPDPSATGGEIAAATAYLAAMDNSFEADDLWYESKIAALPDIDNYLAIGSPTLTDTQIFVQKLARMVRGILKVVPPIEYATEETFYRSVDGVDNRTVGNGYERVYRH